MVWGCSCLERDERVVVRLGLERAGGLHDGNGPGEHVVIELPGLDGPVAEISIAVILGASIAVALGALASVPESAPILSFGLMAALRTTIALLTVGALSSLVLYFDRDENAIQRLKDV